MHIQTQTKDWQSRQTALIGAGPMAKLARSRVLVFGAGGVGGYTIEALARGGVGAIGIADGDVFEPSNLNRQVLATLTTIGRPKASLSAERIAAINRDCEAVPFDIFVTADNAGQLIDLFMPDYIAEVIDTVTSKLAIIAAAKERGIPVISCMGTGNKLDPSRFRVTDISKSSFCPLAKVMRRELHARGISGVEALWSDEEPCRRQGAAENNEQGRRPPASISYVPPVAGLLIAGHIMRRLGEF